jgi:predicted phosphodiesterase
MKKVLYVGDPHAKPDVLDEMSALVGLICTTARQQQVDYICLLGDLFHTHSVIHSPVMAFWHRAFSEMTKIAPTYVIVGNHDMSMSGKKDDGVHALMLYRMDGLHVVSSPQLLPWGAVGIPYLVDRDAMPAYAYYYKGTRTLVCHQTFTGSTYENGFYAHDGVDPDLLPQEYIISGHIHTPQRVGKVWYPGSPRWQIVTDANTERAIWVVEHDDEGRPASYRSFDTSSVCKPIWLLEDREGTPAQLQGLTGTIIVDLHGSEAYIQARRAVLEAQGARVRSFPETRKAVRVRESEGVAVAFKKHAHTFPAKNGTHGEVLWGLAQTRMKFLRGES